MTAKSEKTASTAAMQRREFLSAAAVVGGAAVFGFGIPLDARAAVRTGQYWSPEISTVPEINAWIAIAPDDTVTYRIGVTELGQGILTAVAMIMNEELQADWKKIRWEYASANRDVKEKAPAWSLKTPGKEPYSTDPNAPGGSPSLPAVYRNREGSDPREVSWTGVYRRMMTNGGAFKSLTYYYHLAGAEARERLLLAAAAVWNVPVAQLSVKDGIITHAATGRTTSYGKVAAKAAQTPHPNPEGIKAKTPDQWKLLGTEQKYLHTPHVVTGELMFGLDVRMPGMLYAAAKACPVWGGDVKSYDANAVKNMPGVHSVVQFPIPDRGLTRAQRFSGGVAVIADSYWHAKSALDAMPVEWLIPADVAKANSADMMKALLASMDKPEKVAVNQGNFDTAIARAAKVVEATYTAPHRPRARMEPGNATVLVTDSRVDIWIGDQSPQETLVSGSKLTGVPRENVYLHLATLGGGFGRNGNGPQAEHAIMIAKTVKGRPVHMIWSREEDWNVGTTYGAQCAAKFKAGLDADGWPIAIEARTAMDTGGSGISAGLDHFPYGVPNYRHTTNFVKFHVPVAVRRNTFPPQIFRESFIDELAHAAKKDPYQYRRELLMRTNFPLRDAQVQALDMVAKMSGWGSPLPQGQARGISLEGEHDGVSGVQAQVALVSVTKQGSARVLRSDIAMDTGFSAVNPLAVKKQLEGGVYWGIDDTFSVDFQVKDGRMVTSNYDTVLTARMDKYPREVNIQFFKSERWGASSPEASMHTVASALLDGIYQITGKRIRDEPLNNHDLSWG